MAKRDTTQTDIEDTPETKGPSDTDLAIRAVRAFQGGMGRSKDVKDALADLTPGKLLVVSIGTRVPIKSLETLRDS